MVGVLAHREQGAANGASLLQPETIALVQERAVDDPRGQGDMNQVGCGLGLMHLNSEAWRYWGHTCDMRGAMGHGGSTGGSSGQSWFVDTDRGGCGMVFLTNVAALKPDCFDVWCFSRFYRIQTLLTEKVTARYEQPAAK